MDSQYTIWLIHAQFQSTAKESSQAKITITDCCIVPLYLSQFSATAILNYAISLQSPWACQQQQGANCTKLESAFYNTSAKYRLSGMLDIYICEIKKNDPELIYGVIWIFS